MIVFFTEPFYLVKKLRFLLNSILHSAVPLFHINALTAVQRKRMKSTNDVNKPPWSIFTLWVIAVSGQTEYYTNFHFSSVLRPSQEWPLNFSQYFDGLDHENHIFSERISSWLITLTSTVQFSIVQTSTAQYSLVQFSTACHPFRKPHSLLCLVLILLLYAYLCHDQALC